MPWPALFDFKTIPFLAEDQEKRNNYLFCKCVPIANPTLKNYEIGKDQ